MSKWNVYDTGALICTISMVIGIFQDTDIVFAGVGLYGCMILSKLEDMRRKGNYHDGE